MKYLVCPVCGRPAESLVNGRCRDCFEKTIVLARLPEVLQMVVCPSCGAQRRGARWGVPGADIQQGIKDAITKALKIDRQAENVKICVALTSSNPSIYLGEIEIAADMKGARISTSLEIEVRISKVSCDSCSRRAGGYFEAVVQIRAQGRFPDDEEQEMFLDMVHELVDRQYDKGEGLAFISKIERLAEGTDVYLGSNNVARQIARAAVERFGCTFSDSPTLVGKKDGQDIHRITYSVRLPRLRAGDVVGFEGNVILITESRKRTRGVHLRSGEDFSENTDRLKDAAVLGRASDAVSSVLISEEAGIVQVMHPETFRPVAIRRPVHLSGIESEEIMVLTIGDEIFILPPGYARYVRKKSTAGP